LPSSAAQPRAPCACPRLVSFVVQVRRRCHRASERGESMGRFSITEPTNRWSMMESTGRYQPRLPPAMLDHIQRTPDLLRRASISCSHYRMACWYLADHVVPHLQTAPAGRLPPYNNFWQSSSWTQFQGTTGGRQPSSPLCRRPLLRRVPPRAVSCWRLIELCSMDRSGLLVVWLLVFFRPLVFLAGSIGGRLLTDLF
jgi:hypothetical protein